MSRRILDHDVRKGRGSASNPTGRFETLTTEKIDDGWYREDAPPSPEETVLPDRARSIITSNDSPDVGFDISINPYRGCAHGCVYCFARPTHSYLGLSPGLDFETRLFYKADAVRLLEQELSRPGYVCRPLALGINTDGWQPLERRLEVTRGILEVLAECRHPVSIVTKSALIVRDLDLLAPMAREGLVSVMLSITTLQESLKRTLEPRTASPQARLRTIEALAHAGVPVGVLVAPVIPALTDHELESILESARSAGATRAGYVLLRLPHELKGLFREWLADHAPGRAEHVMSLIRQARGGRDYDARFGERMRGSGTYATLIGKRFELAVRRLGLADGAQRHELDSGKFRPPQASSPQLSLGL